MNRQEMPGCCGIEVIYDLDIPQGPNWSAKGARESALTAHISVSKSRYYGAVLASTIPSQDAAIKALQAKGFTELMTFKGPRHGNMITLWGRTTAEPPAPKVDVVTEVPKKVVRKRTPKVVL